MNELASLRNQLLRLIRGLKTNITTLATDLAKVNAKTQRAGATITGPISIGSQDIVVTWPSPWPDTAYGVWLQLTSGTAALGNIHATVKAGTKTTTDVTVTVAAAATIGADVGLDVLGIRT